MIESATVPLMLRAGLLAACAALALGTTGLSAVKASTEGPRASHFELENGLEVVVIPDNRAPVVTHMVWYRTGAADEQPGKSGIAHFLEHLMFKGTETIAPGDFSKIVARNGGQDNAFTSHDATSYFQRVAKDRLKLVMELEADRMANLRLLEEDVLTERKVIQEERRSRVDNDPSSILNEQMLAALYRSHPYGAPVIGWEHEIAALGRADATEFYERFYAPNNAILVVSGDVTPDEVKRLAKQTYGRLKPHGDRVRHPRPREPEHAAEVRVRLEDARAARATVQRYYHAPSYTTAAPGEAEALSLMMRIAGDGSTGRLYKRLVVEQKQAANAGGWYGGSGLDSGRVGVYAIAADGIPIGDVEAAMDAVLDDIRQNGVTQQELDRVRNAAIADHIYGSDNQATLARRYGWALAAGRTVEHVESLPERLQQVTVEQIKQIADRYLERKNAVTGVLLPAGKATKRPGKAGDAPDKS